MIVLEGQPVDRHLAGLVTDYHGRASEPEMTVFDIRLGLAVLDAIGPAQAPAARRIVEDLHGRTMAAHDGYAARETLAHPLFTAIATDRQALDCRGRVGACALGARIMPDELQGEPASAVRAGDSVVRTSLMRPFDAGRTPPVERSS